MFEKCEYEGQSDWDLAKSRAIRHLINSWDFAGRADSVFRMSDIEAIGNIMVGFVDIEKDREAKFFAESLMNKNQPKCGCDNGDPLHVCKCSIS